METSGGIGEESHGGLHARWRDGEMDENMMYRTPKRRLIEEIIKSAKQVTGKLGNQKPKDFVPLFFR